MKSVKIPSPKETLRVEDVAIPKLSDEMVLVKVLASGVCHTDLHLWEGGYHGAPGVFIKYEDRGVHYPKTPGHEVAGVVENTGPGVKGVKAGEEVLVYPWIGCGKCPRCNKGDDNLCESPRSLGFFLDGGYAEYVVVPHERYLVPIGDLECGTAAPLACSGLTGYHAIEMAAPASEESMVLVGMGGVGLMAVQFAKALSAATVVAVDNNEENLEKGKSFGADVIVNPERESISEVLRKQTGSPSTDIVIDFVNSTKTVETDLALLRKGGRIVLVGLFGGHVQLNLPTIPLRALQILGCITGNYNQLVMVTSLAQQGRIKPIPSKKFSLEEAPQALGLLKEGKILGRALLYPNN